MGDHEKRIQENRKLIEPFFVIITNTNDSQKKENIKKATSSALNRNNNRMMLGTSREIENYKIYPIAQNRDYFLNLFSIKYQ